MASFVKFEDFVEALCNKEHNLGADQLEVYLSNAAPSVSGDADKADDGCIGLYQLRIPKQVFARILQCLDFRDVACIRAVSKTVLDIVTDSDLEVAKKIASIYGARV